MLKNETVWVDQISPLGFSDNSDQQMWLLRCSLFFGHEDQPIWLMSYFYSVSVLKYFLDFFLLCWWCWEPSISSTYFVFVIHLKPSSLLHFFFKMWFCNPVSYKATLLLSTGSHTTRKVSKWMGTLPRRGRVNIFSFFFEAGKATSAETNLLLGIHLS